MVDKHTSSFYEFKEHSVLHHSNEQKTWNLQKFIQNFQVEVTSYSADTETMEFDMIHLDCSFANALRRILIAELPSIAIERVYLYQNSSVMPDEVLCHRLGLIPLNIDPDLLNFPSSSLPDTDELTDFNPNEHIVFELKVQYNKADAKGASTKGRDGATDDAPVQSMAVYSSVLKWVPLENQEEIFSGGSSGVPSPVSLNILLNKLALGDEIEARCVAVKGTCRDHAKFSPVATAYYKFLPVIRLLRTVDGEEAKMLSASFVPGVFELDPDTHKARVANPRLDNGSREYLRHPEFRNGVISVGMNPTHCMFFVETVAPKNLPPARLVRKAFDVMLAKCAHYLAVVDTAAFGSQSCDGNGRYATNSASNTSRTHLNGREVGLEVTHISADGQRGTFTFFGEDHTLGAALRFCILRGELVTFCGYSLPHPLEDLIHFDIQTKGASAIEILRDGLQCLQAAFVHMKTTFKAAVGKYKKTAIAINS